MTKKNRSVAKSEERMPMQSEEALANPSDGQALLAAHSVLGAPYQYIKDAELREPAVNGSFGLYQGLHPKNTLEAILSSLLVGVCNATHDCLSQAARVPPDHLQHRDLNLRHAMKGATVAAQLAEALERAQGKQPGNVSVGNVNVESGGQAIVGTVHSRSRNPDRSDGAKLDEAEKK